MAVAVGALYWCSTQDPTTSQSRHVVELLDTQTRQGCAQAIGQATKGGVVRQRPAPNRVNVEDAVWQLMAADDKRALLSLVACDAFGKREADLGVSEYVVAYGYRSGKRLAMLTEYGIDYE